MNKVKYLSIVIVIFAVLTMACKSNPNLYVASKQVDCVGAGPQKCLLVKENKDENWTYLYDNIQGFNYEPGYEYELIIKKENIANPPADASSIRYILVKELSKTKKDSENLPD